MSKLYKAIGLMSGTSMDGIDLALIESDGKNSITHLGADYFAYSKEFRQRLSDLMHKPCELMTIKMIENELTSLHADLVNSFLKKKQINPQQIDLIAFHGHTILHSPSKAITWQIGNPHLLSQQTGIDVVADFRTRDIVFGGQGAPLVPIYHFYFFARKAAILNIGGIANITYFTGQESDIEAFDICFGNAPSDDLVRKKFGYDFDKNGELSSMGVVDQVLADRILQNELFYQKPPKSFDRDDFAEIISPINNIRVEDALATFAYIHAKALEINLSFLSEMPKEILVCGGGRKNVTIMSEIKKCLPGILVRAVEEIGFNGDSIEAEAFAFLGIRHLLRLPISFQKTTGVKIESGATGGVFYGFKN